MITSLVLPVKSITQYVTMFPPMMTLNLTMNLGPTMRTYGSKEANLTNQPYRATFPDKGLAPKGVYP